MTAVMAAVMAEEVAVAAAAEVSKEVGTDDYAPTAGNKTELASLRTQS